LGSDGENQALFKAWSGGVVPPKREGGSGGKLIRFKVERGMKNPQEAETRKREPLPSETNRRPAD